MGQKCDELSIAEYKDYLEHKRAARRHAQKRLFERFNIELSLTKISKHEQLIFKQSTLKVGYGYNKFSSSKTSLHEILVEEKQGWGGVIVYAVYNHRLRCICTYLKSLKDWNGNFC